VPIRKSSACVGITFTRVSSPSASLSLSIHATRSGEVWDILASRESTCPEIASVMVHDLLKRKYSILKLVAEYCGEDCRDFSINLRQFDPPKRKDGTTPTDETRSEAP